MGGSAFIWSSLGLITRKNAATTPPTPSTKSIANTPRMMGSFDFFFGGAPARAGDVALCGCGCTLWGCGCGSALGALENDALCGCGCWSLGGVGKLGAVGEPVGPVCLGNTTVGADAAMVSSKSGNGWLTGFSPGRSIGIERLAEPCIVALGSKGLSACTNKPPSIVQNFWLSSGKLRLHLGQRFMRDPLLMFRVPTSDCYGANNDGSSSKIVIPR